MLMKLFERCNIGSMELKNRMAFPPITTGFGAENGCFSQELVDFAIERAKGGAAVLFADAVSVDREHQMSIPSSLPYLDSDEQITKYNQFVEIIHQHRAKIVIQLYHAGAQTSLAKRGGRPPVGPSAVTANQRGRIPFPDAVKMTLDEIDHLIQKYALAACRAKDAGFDAVDIGGSGGYLIQQFLSPLTNKRTDKWGGSLDKRMSFPIALIKRIRKFVGDDYPLIFDLCLDEYAEGGITQDLGLVMAETLESHGVDAFRIHGVNMETFHNMIPSMGSPLGVNIPLGKMLKKRLKKAKVMLGQRINDPDLAEQILQEGAADIVLLGRALLSDPYFPQKVAKGNKNSIRKCIACNHCVDRLSYGKSIRCMLNPVLGFERYYAQVPRTESPKSILVIGGGPAGMEAARAAAERGHKVVLAERSAHLGGQLKYAASAPFKGELNHIIEFYEYHLDALDVDICLNLKVDREVISQYNPDKIILATGAEAVTPLIPGVNKSHVVSAQDLLQNDITIKSKSVVAIGGGSLGAEVAELLALQGNRVTIIEKKDAIVEDIGVIMALNLHERLGKLKIARVTGATVRRIEDNKVYYTKSNGEKGSVSAKAVVLAAGYASNRMLESVIKEMVDDVIMVGDCLSPRRIINAIHEGFHAARMIG
jgi:2,4-dienoyl-CoA reductase-like NADH-dependent reductase (Old Yellow Enzyme family)/thioredoxin reductase